MAWIVQNLWLVPALPIFAGGMIALAKQRHRVLAASLAIGSMSVSFLLSVVAFLHVLSLGHGEATRQTFNFGWFQFGSDWLSIGWLLDPLTVVMLLMVTFVGLLIFVYSIGYMADDENFTRFFCFLALFAGAMLGVIVANSLLLLFMCWEVVGLTSYLLIGFWYANPQAAAAAKKAFIVTRIGDLAFFLGMAWLYAQTGTLLFYDNGAGCLEHSALTTMVLHSTIFGMTVSTGVALLIFCGAAGKSGQVPLHVWLPDAMEGPTPVSALIHAATMVAAGVFLIARIYPLMSAQPATSVASILSALNPTVALQVVTWVGAITALFGSLVAVAQFDIKRILAYSTVSQLGYMMMGLGAGGVAVGMFHLITHAFFKALLFLGAGSVIHGCSGEQDIRRMGGLWKSMRITFFTYSAGMLALCGFPLFSGFFSKDEILHATFVWSLSHTPFYMGAIGALLTAFYMTRQVCYVFFGKRREDPAHAHGEPASDHHRGAHESPAVMTIPLTILAVFAVLLGFLGTPVWPWIQSFLEGEPAPFGFAALSGPGPLMLVSSVIVFLGLAMGWLLYYRRPVETASSSDVLEQAQPTIFATLNSAFYINEFYGATIVRLNGWVAILCDWFDRWVWNGVVQTISALVVGLAWVDNFLDSRVINAGFDAGCGTVSLSSRLLSLLQGGRVQSYLRMIGLALVVLAILMFWEQRHEHISMDIRLTAVPFAGALLVFAIGNRSKQSTRWIALAISTIALLIVIALWHRFDATSGMLQFQEHYSWIPALNIEYHVGIDGLGLLMLMLSAIVVPIAMAASWKIDERVSLYFGLVLMLEACLFGTFSALNFVHWFSYWELSLVPAFFLIKLWGGPRRSPAATQFLVYTMVGGVTMLLSFLALYMGTGKFDFLDLAHLAQSGQLMPAVLARLGWHHMPAGTHCTTDLRGSFPWLRCEGASDSPFIRGCLQLTPRRQRDDDPTNRRHVEDGTLWVSSDPAAPLFRADADHADATPLACLSDDRFVGVCRPAQRDLKRTFAYSSINHLGYCMLAIFALAKFTVTSTSLGAEKYAAMNGILLQMFNHGLTAAALFWFIALLEQRSGGLCGLDDFGGLRKVAPVFTGLMGIALFSSLGTTRTQRLHRRVPYLQGTFPLVTWASSLAVIGLLITALMILGVLQRVFSGPLNAKWGTFPDLSTGERIALVPAIGLMFVLGLYPQLILGVVNSSAMQMVQQLKF